MISRGFSHQPSAIKFSNFLARWNGCATKLPGLRRKQGWFIASAPGRKKRVMKKVTFFFWKFDAKNSEAQSKIIKKNHQTPGKLLIYSTKRPLVGKKAWIEKWIWMGSLPVCPLELPLVISSMDICCFFGVVVCRVKVSPHEASGVAWFFWHHFYRCIAAHLGSPIGDAPEKSVWMWWMWLLNVQSVRREREFDTIHTKITECLWQANFSFQEPSNQAIHQFNCTWSRIETIYHDTISADW